MIFDGDMISVTVTDHDEEKRFTVDPGQAIHEAIAEAFNCLGRYPVVARRCLASYTPRLAELQVEGGNVGPNVGSAATPPSRLFTPFGRRRAAALRRGFQ